MQLATAKIAKRVQIAAAFGVTPETVWRWCRDYQRDGIGGLVPAKPGPKGAWKLTDDLVGQIVTFDAQGHTQAAIAGQAGVSSFSVGQMLRDNTAGPSRHPRATTTNLVLHTPSNPTRCCMNFLTVPRVLDSVTMA